MIEPAVIVARPIDGRRTVQPPVREAPPSAGEGRGRDDRPDQPRRARCRDDRAMRRDPARTSSGSRLADQAGWRCRGERRQERPGNRRVGGKLRRELEEQDGKLVAKAGNFFEETGKQLVAIDKLLLVGDGLSDLGGEAEGGGDAAQRCQVARRCGRWKEELISMSPSNLVA